MQAQAEIGALKLALPKGRMQEGVLRLFKDAGIEVHSDGRGYRPRISLPHFEAKLLKPQNVIEMLHHGSRDVGFAGRDWVLELEADLVEILDTGLDPVRLVAAAPPGILDHGRLPERSLVVASEYERLSREWIKRRELHATFVRSYGATEVFPPEDADCIVDNTASGATLAENDLVVVDELMTSSTRLFAHPRALESPTKKKSIDDLSLLLASVLEARRRVMVEVNVPGNRLEAVIAVLPCMHQPTVSPLHAGQGYAIKAAVPRDLLPTVIPRIKLCGGRDIVVSALTQIVP